MVAVCGASDQSSTGRAKSLQAAEQRIAGERDCGVRREIREIGLPLKTGHPDLSP